jgi:cysteine-S-conjugate beta-lyase
VADRAQERGRTGLNGPELAVAAFLDTRPTSPSDGLSGRDRRVSRRRLFEQRSAVSAELLGQSVGRSSADCDSGYQRRVGRTSRRILHHLMTRFELSIAELRTRPGTKWHRYADDVLPAWIAEMDFDVAEPIQAAIRHVADQREYGYEDDDSDHVLAQAFADYMRHRFGWHVGADHVVPVADLVQALFAAVSAFTTRGQRVVLQTPIYPPFLNAVRETGRRVVEHRLVDDGSRFVLDTTTLADVFDANAPLLLLCNPHNPTGRVFQRNELEAVASLAVERQLIVVADEVHADLVYPGQRHIPFASLGADVAARTITMTSATKAYNFPGLRCGLMHFGSEELRERFRASFPDRLLGKVNRFGRQATIAAWRDGLAWLDRVMGVLDLNRARLAGQLAAELPELGHHSPEATYLAWLDCRSLALPMPPQAFLLEHARIAVNDGDEFGPPGRGFVRLNFATAPSTLDEILERLVSAVRHYHRSVGHRSRLHRAE